MKFEVYSDESSPEVLTDRKANKFLVLGSVWIPAEYRETLKNRINNLKVKHRYSNEIKWNKVAPSTFDFYKELVELYFELDIRFRSLVVEADKVDKVRFHNDDSELSFYKFYYQLLHHWILDFNDYSIFIDHKVNRDRGRIHKLKEVLGKSNLFSSIDNVQAIHSHESIGIQLADFLIGAVNGKFNSKISSAAKIGIILEIEKKLGYPIQPTGKAVEKFNVFKINLQGGW